MRSLAAVTGGSGFLGRALEGELAGRGLRLRGLFRSASERSEAWREAGHEIVFGALEEPGSLARLVEGADVVHHLAARKAKDDPGASHRVNVEGTARLARVAAEAGVGRFVYVSSISVYAATPAPEPVEEGLLPAITEAMEPRNLELLNTYSASKYGGERVLRELEARGEAPPVAIVRPTNVYGPWGRAWFLDWVARLERFPVVVGGDVAVDLVHVEDVARALARAGEAEAAAGQLVHVGHQTVTLADYLIRLGHALDLSVRRLPPLLDRLAREAIERGHRLLKGDRMSTPLTRSVRFPHARARRLLGYEPRVELEEGLAGTVRWYHEVWRARRVA